MGSKKRLSSSLLAWCISEDGILIPLLMITNEAKLLAVREFSNLEHLQTLGAVSQVAK